MANQRSDFRVTMETIAAASTQAIAAMDEWRALEARTQRPFFLSSAWIQTWLTHNATSPWLVKIHDKTDTLVAMGWLEEHRELRHGILPVRQLWLNATGTARKDMITIEYNNLLCAEEDQDNAWRALIDYLHTPHTPHWGPNWDELVLPGITDKTEQALLPYFHGNYRRSEAGSQFVDLAGLRKKNITQSDSYLATLSKNTRSQIRRSLKLYRTQGPLTITRAENTSQALDWFAKLATLHEAKWAVRGEESGMKNPLFMQFHHTLIDKGLASDAIDIVCVKAGDYPIGYLYNFTDRDIASFYCSGFVQEEDNRLKPGMVSQVLAIDYYLRRGFDVYDFMGGDDRYKASLGQQGPDIVITALQRQRASLQLESIGRRLKASLRAQK